jgi:hypothetical protein
MRISAPCTAKFVVGALAPAVLARSVRRAASWALNRVVETRKFQLPRAEKAVHAPRSELING